MNALIRSLSVRVVQRSGGCAALLLGGLLLAAPLTGDEKKPVQAVNLNTATVEELARLPGVGEVIARRIIRHRARSGKFRSVDELLVVRGISAKKLEKLRPYVTVEEPAPGEPERKPD